MEILQFEHKSRRTTSTIEALLGGCQVGDITYTLPKKGDRPIKLGLVRVRGTYRRNGIGTQLVSEFVKTIGPGRSVHTVISNNESLDVLENLEPKRDKDEAARISLSEPAVLVTLPIVNVLEQGHLKVVSVRVEYNPRNTLKNPLSLIRRAKIEAIT